MLVLIICTAEDCAQFGTEAGRRTGRMDRTGKYVEIGEQAPSHGNGMSIVGQFRDGIQHGLQRTYDEHGAVFQDSEYADGQLHGKVRFANVNGAKRLEFRNNGRIVGPALVYKADGTKVVEQWSAGALVGRSRGLFLLHQTFWFDDDFQMPIFSPRSRRRLAV
jgi:hypothetical protein